MHNLASLFLKSSGFENSVHVETADTPLQKRSDRLFLFLSLLLR